ncbi:AMP-binding protein [Amycolatopsis sp. NBC_01480]|uniref:AMP-binding protein n=1 Tax=Amycolatopsis sp. NBC_01480 TaxID=2903562 RepID=UPI002E2BD449|nr:AMP-binding protein [Amycolatopsis sp. NBC_01480]
MPGLDTALTPLRFLARAAEVHPARTAVIDGARRWTWADFAGTVTVLAQALRRNGIRPGDRVVFLGTNSAELLAAHFAVPLAGAVLVALNTRLSPAEIAYICEHSGATLLLGDGDLLSALRASPDHAPVSVIVEIPGQDGGYRSPPGAIRYADFLAHGTDQPIPWEVDDETRTIAINYTSGTTGRPKGVEYSHRGAYLNALGEVHHQGFGDGSRYLWTLPMFHCNGWCTTWALTAAAGTHICVRGVRGAEMWSLIDTEAITHLAGAPVVLTTLASAPQAHRLDRPLTATTAGAPPSPTIITRMRELGAEVVHVYGLTETYGPYAVCEVGDDWAARPADQQSRLLARQGVGMLTSERLRVVRPAPDPAGCLLDVVADGVEMGEIVMRGNSVMKGYHRDAAATAEAFAAGWFHSGDLGVMHPDGYVQLLDRAKDIVISGGENISTVEVEQALLSHPDVSDVAVIGVPDDRWGERPKAFAVLVPGAEPNADALITHVRSRIAHYKAPREVEFVTELPRTSTGKVRKNELREAAWAGSALKIRS